MAPLLFRSSASKTLPAAALFFLGFMVCNPTKIQAHRSPADTSGKTAVAPDLPALPLDNPARGKFISLLAPAPDSRQSLIRKVEDKFASGEQNYKAGHLEAARKDFDEAVDAMLQS